MKAVNFNTVDWAVIGGKSVDRIYAGSTLVWKYLDGGVEAPTNVLALLSDGDVGINWDVPSTNQGVTIAQYFVTYSLDGGNDIFLSYAPTNSLVYPLGGYPSGTYRFGVRALTNEGTGAAGYSNTVTKT